MGWKVMDSPPQRGRMVVGFWLSLMSNRQAALSKDAYEAIGKPEAFTVLVNEDERLFAIRPATLQEEGARRAKVPGPSTESRMFRFLDILQIAGAAEPKRTGRVKLELRDLNGLGRALVGRLDDLASLPPAPETRKRRIVQAEI